MAVITWNGISTTPLRMSMGLKQECILSPLLFSIYIADLPEFLFRWGRGVCLNDTWISILMFADDLVIFSDSENDFKQLLLGLGEYANMWHLEISEKKSSIMVSPCYTWVAICDACKA